MKKVLYLGGFELPDKNAAAQRVMGNALLLSDMGYEVTMIGVSKEPFSTTTEVYHEIKCIKKPYPLSLKQWVYHVTAFVSLRKIKMLSPDVIVVYNFPAVATLRIRRYCNKYHVKLIHDVTEWEHVEGYSLHGIIKRIDILCTMHYCMKRMDGVIAISRFFYERFKDCTKTILVPPTVDLENEKWNRKRELAAHSPKDLVYAGSPGGVVKDRLDIIVEEVEKHSNLLLKVVGLTAEQYFEAYKKKTVSYRNVQFLGRLSHQETLRQVSNSDFQLIIRDRNRKNDAGFPTKLVESVSCGIPVIATIFSNITDYIVDGENGLLITENTCLGDVLLKVESMSQEDIVEMKNNCLRMTAFDYRQHKASFAELFRNKTI